MLVFQSSAGEPVCVSPASINNVAVGVRTKTIEPVTSSAAVPGKESVMPALCLDIHHHLPHHTVKICDELIHHTIDYTGIHRINVPVRADAPLHQVAREVGMLDNHVHQRFLIR